MIIKTILILPLIFSLYACASTSGSVVGSANHKQTLNTQASKPDHAVLFIYRLSEFLNGALDYLIGFDPQPVVTLTNGKFTRIEVPPGLYKFNFASDVMDYNKHRDYGNYTKYSGSAKLMVHPDVVNVVHFDASPGSFASIKYGEQYLKPIRAEGLGYQPATIATMTTAIKLADAPESKQAALTRIASANKKIAHRKATLFTKRKKNAACKLKNKNWVYTGSQCKAGFAHGQGSSVDTNGLEFIGQFKNGIRISGAIHQAGNMIFEGKLIDDKPHGQAICYYQGEYEECRFYKGKRIDTLYKIRKENAVIKQELADMKASNAANAAAKQNISGNSGTGIGDYAADAAKKEAMNRAASFIFDQLF